MADAVATVRDRLLSISAVTAITTTTRIYSGILPQSPVFPAVLVQRVSDVQTSHLRGGNNLMMTRVQVTSIALSRAAAVALDHAVQGDGATTGLNNWSGTTGSPGIRVQWAEPAVATETYASGELKQFRIDRDYKVHHEQ